MAGDTPDIKSEAVDTALEEMKLEEQSFVAEHKNTPTAISLHGHAQMSSHGDPSRSCTPMSRHSRSQSPVKKQSASTSPKSEEDLDEQSITVTVEPGKAPKLSRKSTQRVIPRAAPLYDHMPDVTEEAVSVFQVIKDCIYGSKYMGSSEHDALDCDCSEEWSDGTNHACGEDSDCINRATKMECVDGGCNCGDACQNQRFQRKQYSSVTVFQTEKKGFGLRTSTDLQPNDFIFEYIGEVINEPTFRRRTIQYDEEGIKHFYFMSLTKHEFVDATKKGNLGRFCNHSCNPNCYVDKWVVGEKLRMGIFAERHIKAGEELVFNYNVDRYGADPQPCYCGENNCTGFIGGKTQTERATKLSHATIEALGIDDGDGWDTAVAKKPRKKKTGEDDEEYVNNLQPRGLDEDGVRKVMATLMQCKEKWIAVKLLDRIQRCDDDRVRNRVVQMHGYQILRTTLTTWKDDNNVVLQILDILYKFPRLTRNKISDSKIETSIASLTTSEHEDVAFESKRLIEEWSKLEVAYRIPRKKFDPNAAPVFDRRDSDRAEPAKQESLPTINAPTGPKSSFPQRNTNFIPSRPIVRRPYNSLPSGWFTAMDDRGQPYYYSKSGQTTWARPTVPAAEPPPPPKAPPKSVQTAKAIQDIIDSITKSDSGSANTPSHTSNTANTTPKEKKKPSEKWRSLSQEKQMKVYENTLFPHIKHVMQKFHKQLPKEDLKKFAKEVSKKLVSSDYKNNRVEDPTKISEKQEKKVKKYVRDFFERAVEKKKIIDKRKREKELAAAATSSSNGEKASVPVNGSGKPGDLEKASSDVEAEEDPIDLTPVSPIREEFSNSPAIATPALSDSPELKRKRTGEDTPGEESESKRFKEEDLSPPPPPPPPPAEGLLDADADMHDISLLGDDHLVGVTVEETEEEREMRKQEEDLMRENEEALKMEMDGSLKVEEEMVKANFSSVSANGLLGAKVGFNGNNNDADTDGPESGMVGIEKGLATKREGMVSH